MASVTTDHKQLWDNDHKAWTARLEQVDAVIEQHGSETLRPLHRLVGPGMCPRHDHVLHEYTETIIFRHSLVHVTGRAMTCPDPCWVMQQLRLLCK